MKSHLNLILIIFIGINVTTCGCLSENGNVNSFNSTDFLNTDQITDAIYNFDINSINTPEIVENVSGFGYNTGTAIIDQFIVFAENNPAIINETHIVIADNIASTICGIGEIDERLFTDYDYFAEKLYKLEHVTKALNENLNLKIQNLEVSKENFNLLAKYRKISSFVPVIDSYTQLYNSSKKLPSEYNEDYYNFYMNLFIFGADIAFTQQQMAYKGAFKATGILADTIGLKYSTKIIGYQGYGLVLSSIHWKIRNEVNENIDNLFELLRDEEIIQNVIGI